MSDGLHPLPNGWEWRKLENVAILNMGQSPDSSTYNSQGVGLPFFQGKKDFGKIHPEATQYCSKPIKIALPQDILMSVRAPVGPTNIANQECCIGRGLGAIRAKKEIIETFYLLYYFKYFEEEISKKGKGSTFAAITKSELANLDIPLPPIDEQKRIVDKLDGLFAKIDKAIGLLDESIASASALLPSALNEVFGELSEKYNYLSVDKLSGQIQSGFAVNKKHEISNGYVHLRTHNISTGGKLNFDYLVKIEQSMIKASCNKISKGDILFNNTNSTELVGKTALVDKDYNFAFSNHLTKISLKRSLANPEYFVFAFMFLFNNGYFMSICNKWIGQSGINTNMLKEITLPLPPLDIQAQTVEHLDAVREKSGRLTAKLKTQRDELVALKASLLERAFKGEL